MPDDGVSEVPTQTGTEEKKMAVDLPEGILTKLLVETMGNIQATNNGGRNIATAALGVIQGATARNYDKLGAVESRAVSGVLATPLADPTTPAKVG